MRSLSKIWFSSVVAALAIGSAFAQHALPSSGSATDAYAVRVRLARAGGLCGGLGYCTQLTTVEPSFVTSELKNSRNRKRLPNIKTKRAITKKEWKELQGAIDAKALKALPQPVSCRPCVDLPESYLVVEYSDGQNIVVPYDDTNPAAAIAAVLRKIPPIQMRLKL